MNKKESLYMVPIEHIEQCIYIIRGYRVMLDQDLAILYKVSTGRLNEQVSRNINRFPEDFAFKLTKEEWKSLISQFAISKQGRGGRRKLPIAFTEQGVAMLSSVLRSAEAANVNIEIMRAFVRMRHVIASQKEMNKELAEVKSFLLKHTHSSDREFRRIWQSIEKMSQPPTHEERRIGFDMS